MNLAWKERIVVPTGIMVGSLTYEFRKEKKDADKDLA